MILQPEMDVFLLLKELHQTLVGVALMEQMMSCKWIGILIASSLLTGCEKQEMEKNSPSNILECSDSASLLFDTLASELQKMDRGEGDYMLMHDERNSRLRNRHLQLRRLAEDRLAEGMLTKAPVPEHWDLICRWYELMAAEAGRLHFAGLLDLERERAYVRHKIGLGKRMACYGDDEEKEILSRVKPYLGDVSENVK